MIRILLAIAAVIAALFIYRWLRTQPPKQRWQVLMVIGGVVLLALVLTGRMHWLFALIGAMIPAVQRLISLIVYLPALQRVFRTFSGNKPSAGQTSEVETDYLYMELDHDSGELRGHVKTGLFSGKQLNDLSLEELQQLYAEYCQIDEDSKLLLQNYIDRTHGTAWHSQQQNSEQTNSTSTSSEISEQEAYAILGLEQGASKQDIITAHKRLMQKLHPDRGGSSYLAIKINQAKEILLAKHQ